MFNCSSDASAAIANADSVLDRLKAIAKQVWFKKGNHRRRHLNACRALLCSQLSSGDSRLELLKTAACELRQREEELRKKIARLFSPDKCTQCYTAGGVVVELVPKFERERVMCYLERRVATSVRAAVTITVDGVVVIDEPNALLSNKGLFQACVIRLNARAQA